MPPEQVLFRVREQSPDDQVRLPWKTTMQFPWWVNLMIREGQEASEDDVVMVCRKDPDASLLPARTTGSGRYLVVPLLHPRVTKYTHWHIDDKDQRSLASWNVENFHLYPDVNSKSAVQITSYPLHP
ncbi:hypothetical protein OIU76_022491 [Salix suchowensis]|nr:hypothetical protein OIU76_022491 [Salix suchowensis]